MTQWEKNRALRHKQIFSWLPSPTQEAVMRPYKKIAVLIAIKTDRRHERGTTKRHINAQLAEAQS